MGSIKWHQADPDEVLDRLKVKPAQGLSDKEAGKRRAGAGWNELAEKKGISPLTLFLNQFKDFMVLVLVGAVLISGLLGEYLDAVTIIAIIIMNGILGFVQEFRAERSLRALKEMSAPSATVRRNGRWMELAARELVPGDIVRLESGDRIPADVRLLEAMDCTVEESALTGESIPVHKHAGTLDEADVPLGDRRNLGFLGTMVTKGSCTAIVVETGMQTEMGKIADLIQNTESMETPLQHRLEQLGKILIGLSLVLTVMVVVAGIWHGQPPYGMFLAGVSLAVAAIPEGLPAIVTIALALGVQRMIRRKAIVRKLPSVETLGCASVICSDKTGTLTQNKMTVTHLWTGGRTLEVGGSGYAPQGDFVEQGRRIDPQRDAGVRRVLQIGVLCNNAELLQDEAEWLIKGDPTEGALTVLGAKAGLTGESLQSLYERVHELPFDSERKRMTVLVRHQGGRLALCKGAPDVLLEHCRYVMWDGKVVPLDSAMKRKVAEANESMAGSALRVLGLAYREVKPQESADAELEEGLIFVGLTGMIDPPREEVKEAIRTSRQAGIRTLMITGDHRATAEAIAVKLGIVEERGKSISGTELEKLSDEALEKAVGDTQVFARVSPEHKLRIVKALQRQGHVTAMTGDGVNDAPAVKAADIGIAMGKSGTDVTRESSSLILADDNYATIVAAIEEGRGIYENIRKFIRYLLASNVGEILTMFLAMMAGMPLPLVPIQILWVNLVTDGLPAMALGVDQAEDDLMRRKPRSRGENIFAGRLGWKIISRGIVIGLCTLAAFWITLQAYPDALRKAQTVAFATLVMAQLIHVFDCRSSRSIFHRRLLENRYLVLAVLSSVLLLLAVLYWEPLQPVFKTVDLDLRDWSLILLFSGIPTFLFGMASLVRDLFRKKRTFRLG